MQQLEFRGSAPERLFGTECLEQDGESVAGRMVLGDWARSPRGGTSVGALGVLADEVLGYALMASLPVGSWSISTEIWIDLIAALPLQGALTARAEARQSGSFSVGEVYDAAGRPVAVCRQRGRRTARPAAWPEPVDRVATERRPQDLGALLGLRPEGGAFAMETGPELVNPLGMLHGGVSLAASDVVASLTRQEAGCELTTSSVHIVHTRGVPLGTPVLFRAETRHAGRSLWVTDVTGTVAGRTCTVATVTAEG